MAIAARVGICGECGRTAQLRVVICRLYSRREQHEYRYEVCEMDWKVLTHIHADRAKSYTKRKLWHQGEFEVLPWTQ